MKLTRAQFLKALPAAVLALAGCTAAPTAPADTDELVFRGWLQQLSVQMP